MQLLDQLACLNVDLADADFAADFQQLHDVGRIPLDRFDSHVVVHSLLHEGSLGERLALVGNCQCVQPGQLGQVEEDVRLVVAQTADRVLAIVWV